MVHWNRQTMWIGIAMHVFLIVFAAVLVLLGAMEAPAPQSRPRDRPNWVLRVSVCLMIVSAGAYFRIYAELVRPSGENIANHRRSINMQKAIIRFLEDNELRRKVMTRSSRYLVVYASWVAWGIYLTCGSLKVMRILTVPRGRGQEAPLRGVRCRFRGCGALR
jgi:hypothetical protein